MSPNHHCNGGNNLEYSNHPHCSLGTDTEAFRKPAMRKRSAQESLCFPACLSVSLLPCFPAPYTSTWKGEPGMWSSPHFTIRM
ncbi:hypothetical protein E2C01_066958 [Portunus trituberculatus]|uniref:Uncharacterized protein n=1 Tax=Portunus trituberculatus TaxID=210409 RepID=A0A5B7HS59_PORTR|nr:hypothetical protein [Portunus trituberculatus]